MHLSHTDAHTLSLSLYVKVHPEPSVVKVPCVAKRVLLNEVFE